MTCRRCGLFPKRGGQTRKKTEYIVETTYVLPHCCKNGTMAVVTFDNTTIVDAGCRRDEEIDPQRLVEVNIKGCLSTNS